MHTYASALALSGVTVPAHLAAEATVPVLTGPQAQGDLMLIPVTDAVPEADWSAVPAGGVQVIRGEATGNTHWLHRGFESPDVRWARDAAGARLGYLLVPDGQSALLIHTDEHGANGIGPGAYAIHRKRARAVTIGQVAPQARDHLIED